MLTLNALIPEFDKALRSVFAKAPTRRPMPGADLPEAELSTAEKQHVAALMRVKISSYSRDFSSPSNAPYSLFAMTSAGGKITGLFL